MTKKKMDLKEAKEIVGNRASWELVNMKKALSMCPMLNTEEENKRLEASKIVLRERHREESTPRTKEIRQNRKKMRDVV